MRGLAATLVAASGLVLGAANPAQAWEGPGHEVNVVHVSSRKSGHVGSQILATCSGQAGMGCSITTTKAATRSISLDLGFSRSFVASKIGISSSSTQSIAVTCSATLTKTKKTLTARPSGTLITYKLEKKYYDNRGRYIGSSWSGNLTAFNPIGASCSLS